MRRMPGLRRVMHVDMELHIHVYSQVGILLYRDWPF
jgi:hypothetical protein